MDRGHFTALVLALPLWGGCGSDLPEAPDWGVELGYRILHPDDPDSDRSQIAAQVEEILTRRGEWAVRAETYMDIKPGVTLKGDDWITLRLPGIDRSTIGQWKTRFAQMGGKLDIYALAEKNIQEHYNREKTIPPDYRLIKNVPTPKRSQASEHASWNVDQVLLRLPPVYEGVGIIEAMTQGMLKDDVVEWVISLSFNVESSYRTDKARIALNRETPPGRLAIVIDNRLHSTPKVSGATFQGRAQLSFGEDEVGAVNMSSVLKTGALPVPIGKISDGKPVHGEPESETYYGKARESKAPPPAVEEASPPDPPPPPKDAPRDFSGIWATLEGPMEFTQEGNLVSGTWNFFGEELRIAGRVRGEHLNYTFTGPESNGDGQISVSESGKAVGGIYRPDFLGEGQYLSRAGVRVPTTGKDLKSSLVKGLSSEDATVQAYSAISLGISREFAEEAVPILVHTLKNPDPRLSGSAAVALGEMGSKAKSAVPALLKTLGHENYTVRNSAVAALGGIGAEAVPAVPALTQLLSDKDPDVRGTVADSLGGIGPSAKEAIPALTGLLKDKDPTVVFLAAVALGSIEARTQEAVPVLIKAVKEEEFDEIRLRAVRALGGLGPAAKKAISTLTEALKEEALKEAAEESLIQIKSEN